MEDEVDLDSRIDEILIYRGLMSPEQRARILKAFMPKDEDPKEIDLIDEVRQQIQMVHILRDSVIDVVNKRTLGSTKDAKEAITASTNLLQTLTKLHDDIYNMDRIRALETTLIAFLKDFPSIEYEEFMKRFEEKLAEAA